MLNLKKYSVWLFSQTATKWVLHILFCAVYVGLIGTLADFLDTPVSSIFDYITALLHGGVVVFALFTSLLLLSLLGKWVFAIAYSLLCLIASCLAYFRYTIHFSFNTMIMDVIFQNDINVSADMVTWPLLLWMLLTTAIGGFIAWKGGKYSLNMRSKPIVAIALLAAVSLGVLFGPSSRLASPINMRIPFSFFYTINQYVEQKHEIKQVRPRQCTYATVNAADSVTVVVVIGEAVRPSNLSINGYHRQTTPCIEKWNVVSLDSVFSDYVYTNRSVPHLLSRATTQNPELAYSERSFIDVFKAAGIKTATILNQDAERPYAYFMHEADTVIACNTSKTVYNFSKWLDQDVLLPYQALLTQNQYPFILIHTIGSHWWYNAHYHSDYEVFKPVMQSRNIALCDSMEIVNAYDNTILYADYIWGQLIESLQHKKAVLIYLSDHGEALGEEGVWLHASELPIMHHTAAFVWMSPLYKEAYPQKYNNLLQHKHKRLKTDFLYHSVIDAASIETDVLDSSLSVF